MSLDPHVLLPGSLEGAVAGEVVTLSSASAHHLRRVLRRAEGGGLSLTDGLGRSASGVLVEGGARLVSAPATAPQPATRLVLAQALSKGRRAEDAVRMCCELGVDRIVPVIADRTQGRPDAEAGAGLVERWQAVAQAALEQARAVRSAQVERCVSVATLAASACPEGGLRLVGVPGSAALPEVLGGVGSGSGPVPSEVVVAIGPEGGWSDTEVAQFVANGWVPVGLGPSVLRTEHAGPVALAVVAAMTGRWRTLDVPGHGIAGR